MTSVETNFLKYGSNVLFERSLKSSEFDGVLLVTYPKNITNKTPKPIRAVVESALNLDKGLESEVAVINCSEVSGSKLVLSPTGPITPYHDVRSVKEAAKNGMIRALKAGIKKPLIILPNVPEFKQNDLVTILGALEALYVPIAVREFYTQKKHKFEKLGFYAEDANENCENLIKNAIALEEGRIIARDVAGGDPERMSPINVEAYVKQHFEAYPYIKIEVISDIETIEKKFPLFGAVNRAANEIERHKGRIIFLTYSPNDTSKITDTLMLVGKGVSYDTGGADIKAGGVMAGMSRDKSGAGAVVGFLKTCAMLKPPHVKVIGVLSMVRNSVGENCYVSDEVIVSRSGKLIRIGNTDAEGRMVMADVVCMLKDQCPSEINPHIYTVATLTGHSVRTVGVGYSIVIDNFAARNEDHSKRLQESGDLVGDVFEISMLRKEDFATHRGIFEGDDILQSLNPPSTAVNRGHQGPAAFIIMASGLENENIKFSHIDMAPSAGIAPKEPTAAPMLALAQHYKIFKDV